MLPNIKIVTIDNTSPHNVRKFCLKVIKEVYGFDYRPDWHADLDSLLNENGEYSEKQNGSFYVAFDGNRIVGTIGVKSLLSKPSLLSKFKQYKDGKDIGSIWRAYVDKKYRGKGLGKQLLDYAENFAKKAGYQKIYLHTSKTNPNAVAFWQKRGFKIILEESDPDQTIHMDKKI